MSKSGSSAPDPNNTANAQTGQNVNSAIMQSILNNVGVNSPYGSSSFNQTGSTNVGGYNIPQFSQNISLSPAQQQILNNQQRAQTSLTGGATQNLANQINSNTNSGTYGLGNYSQNLQNSANQGGIATRFNQGQQVQGQVNTPEMSQAIHDAQDAAYNQQAAYLQPQQAQKQSQLDSSLAQQGITQGSNAYNNAQSENSRNNTFANQQAQNAAVLAGQQEQNTLYGQALQSGEFANTAAAQQYQQGLGAAQFGNTAEGQQFGENLGNAQLNNAAQGQGFNQQYQVNNLPFNQLASLNGQTQVTNPQANSPSQSGISAAPIGSYIAQNYQNQLGAQNNQTSGIYGLGGTLGAAGINYAGSPTGSSWLKSLY